MHLAGNIFGIGRGALLLSVLPALALLCAQAQAVSALVGVGDYSMRVWKAEDGLPDSKVNAVLQTRDGYLWVGTFAGLARFDGVAFTVFNSDTSPELRGSDITSLYEATDGALWIGHETGEITRYKAGRFESVRCPAAVEAGTIRGMAEDEAGNIWVMSDRGLLIRASDGKVVAPLSRADVGMCSLAHSENGTIWICRYGRLSQLERGELRAVPFPDLAAENYTTSICTSTDGGVWVVVDGRLMKWKNNAWQADMGKVAWGFEGVTSMMEARSGWLLAGVGNGGVFAFRPGSAEPPAHFSRTNGVPNDWIISLCDDHEGNWWVGTGGGGALELRQKRVKTIIPPDQWQGRAVLCVSSSRDGSLWIGSEGAGLYHYQRGSWDVFGERELHPYVWSVLEDPQGTIWIGTWGGGLYALSHGELQLVPTLAKPAPPIRAILISKQGGLWIGTEDGLLRYNAGQVTWHKQLVGQPFRRVRSIVEDGAGGVWCGSSGGGLAYLKGDQASRFGKQDGLASDFVECLHLDAEGALWVGSSGEGLTRVKKDHFAVISARHGLPNSYICDIEEDAEGCLWMSSHGGILRARKSELDACANGQTNEISCLAYGLEDGMPTLTCSGDSQPAGCGLADGTLWFPTVRGLVTVDPRNVKIHLLPPPVVIEKALVDDAVAAQGPELNSILRIQPGRHRLEFQYTALSFFSPEQVRFKYRLEGLEGQWVDAGAKRAANFNYLPPGSYAFQVIACNGDSVWNLIGAKVAFVILPFWWQTWWAHGLGVMGLLAAGSGSVWFGSRRRMRRKLEESERQRGIERERSRIAQDIHDELGAHLTRITMLSESVRGQLKGPDEAVAGLTQIHGTASHLTRAMDETVWAVNPKHDTLEGFASYAENFALDFLGAVGIDCQLEFPLEYPRWPLTSETRHNLFLAYKEAINNIVKHSGATSVCVALRLLKDSFELTVQDNGRGFALKSTVGGDGPPSGRGGGNGLPNLRERLSRIGGDCQIDSVPGRGTTVLFRVRIG
ncbi:MAG: two-component regulator propeller domain-containing protein [Verrucomicrobiota bacterium]|jgi:ligand-binding sensor domain-containing protein/signal transduction histidine kinase